MERIDEYRYERKYRADLSLPGAVEVALRVNALGFRRLYPPRYVNSLYFDTLDLQNYRDNVEGNPNRTKMRVRWYGSLRDSIRAPRFEVKRKRALMGTKIVLGLEGFCLEAPWSPADLYGEVRRTLVDETFLPHIRVQRPILFTRYHRQYFGSQDGRFRVTLDREMSFHAATPDGRRMLRPVADHDGVVVELKYDRNWDMEAPEVLRGLSLGLSRNSKYVNGVQALRYHRGMAPPPL